MQRPKVSAKKHRTISPVLELVSNSTEEADLPLESRWIQSHISMRQCSRFVAIDPSTKSEKESMCFCGLPFYKHSRIAAIGNSYPSSSTWSSKTDTKASTTNAFGEIDFVGYEDIQRKYVRVDGETDMDDVVSMLLNVWRIKRPNLLISVISANENFNMKTKLKDVFRRGLIKVSKSTGAWIITGGTNNGVMKYVGEAVRDYRLTTESTIPVPVLGITTWGCIKNREDLQDDFGIGLWPASYTLEHVEKNERCLDPNHTHFILVDNGTNGQLGAEIQFRAKLEKAMANIKTGTAKDDVAIPLVLLLVEGSLNSLQSTWESTSQGTPLVVVKGSGGLADIIAFAFENATEVEVIKIENGHKRKRSMSVTEEKIVFKLKTLIIDAFGGDDVEDNWKRVRGIIEKRDLVTVFDYRLTGTDSSQGIDVAILKALLKANRDQVFDQLRLALAWNRIDIAKSEIFTEEKIWPPGSLKDTMHTAIVQNRVDFVELFLDNGISMKEFLTSQRLLFLYNRVPKHSVLQSLLDRAKNKNKNRDRAVEIRDIKRLIKMLVDINVEPYASRPANQKGFESNKRKESKFPFEDLFLWSVLLNRQEMAKLFWKQGKDATAYALLAFGILHAMAERTDDTELRNSLTRNADEFGDLAVGVINECFEADEKKTTALLIRKLEQFDGASCLKIGLKTDNKQFISQPACQDFFRDLWMGELSLDNGTFRLFISPIFLGPFLLKVKEKWYTVVDHNTCIKDSTEGNPANKSQSLERKMQLKKQLSNATDTHAAVGIQRQNSTASTSMYKTYKLTGILWFFYRIKCIYTAPVMIFAHSVIAYILFLGLFSFMLLVEFNKEVGPIEKLIFVWVTTLMIEEMRQFSSTTQRKQKEQLTMAAFVQKMIKKKEEYLNDDWNRIDVLTITLFLMGLGLRFCTIDISYARIVYAATLMAFFFRILHIFTVHKELGPKILMIRRMMVDLVFFMIILMVFVLSYSITSYAIMYPNSNFSWKLVHHILRRGYWNLYGELFLDEIDGDFEERCTHNKTLFVEDLSKRCPETPFVGVVLMAIYILFANVLLLNILIAMFSNTFQKVQDNTDRLWNYMRCSLIYEFYNKPFLPAPLSLPIYVFLFLKWIASRFCSCCQETPEHSELQDREIMQWENIIADAYTQRIKRDLLNKMETKVYEMNERVEELMVRVGEIHTAHESSHHFDRKFDLLDDKITKIMKIVSSKSGNCDKTA